MNGLSKNSVSWEDIDESSHNQRIDNFLFKRLKGVPKNHIYQILRSGQIRVNSKRVGATYRVQIGDKIRIPPIRVKEAALLNLGSKARDTDLVRHIVHEDDAIIVLDKPSGVAVHGGSGISFGVIEQMRAARPQTKFLELVHRLDRDTSGILLLAKKRSALLALHEAIRKKQVKKYYLTLIAGQWHEQKQHVKLSLSRYVTAVGERRVSVNPEGQDAHTVFRLKRRWKDFSLLQAELLTGRTHQIRVHLSHLGFAIAGDDKYGDFELNKRLSKLGLKRMFLHASEIRFEHPLSNASMTFQAPLPSELVSFLSYLDTNEEQQ